MMARNTCTDSEVTHVLELVAAGILEFPNIDPIIVSIGPIAIRWYSMAYIGGLAFAWWYIRRQAAKPGAPMSVAHIDDFITVAMLAIIVGGRLGYVLFYRPDYYFENPAAIIRLWDGGMSFHGGLIGVILSIFWFVKKQKLDLLKVADVIASVSPVGLLAGRLANFINGELWGRASDVPWAMVFPADPTGLPRHPSQLYEALGEGLLLFLILQYLYLKTSLPKKAPGVIAGIFFAGYGLARFLVEFVREPDAAILLGLTRGQLLTVPMFLFAAWLIHKGIKRAQEAR